MPTYLGPADHLIYEGRIIPRGQMVAVSGKALDSLIQLGHQFEGHQQSGGPAFVDQPQPVLPAIGANGGPITTREVLASSSEHQAAVHEAALQAAAAEEKAQPRATEEHAAKR